MKSIFLGVLLFVGNTVFAADFCVLDLNDYTSGIYGQDPGEFIFTLTCTAIQDNTIVTRSFNPRTQTDPHRRLSSRIQALTEGKLEILQYLTERNYVPYGEANTYIRR